MTNATTTNRQPAAETGEAQALFQQGVARLRADRLEEAKALLERVLEQAPEHSFAIQYLGVIARREGRIAEAIKLMRRSLELNSDDIGCYHNLSRAYLDNGNVGRAIALLRQALEKAPERAGLWNQLANALKQRKDFDEAVEACNRAIALEPENLEYRLSLGAAYHQMGRLDDAMETYREILERDPDYASAHLNLGALLKTLGRMEEARETYRRAIALDPRQTGSWRSLVDLAKHKPDDPEVGELEALLARDDLSDEQRMNLSFALGKVYDDIGDYDRAFKSYREGNRLKRKRMNYRVAGTVESFRRIREAFDASLMERLAGLGEPDPTPIFILGMPRSGTTLTEQILASHPQVFGAGELYDLSKVFREAPKRLKLEGQPQDWAGRLDAESLTALGRDYVQAIRHIAPDARHVTDKMPSNFRFVGLIRLILPNARIIHTRRHPADTCLSCYTKLFSEGQEFSYDLSDLARFYRAYEEMMAHWRAVLPPGAMLEVQYERLVADIETQARRLVAFCGLEWDEACLRFFENKRSVATASVSQVRRPVYNSSVQRWRRYADHLGPFFKALAEGYRESGPE